MSRKSLIDNLFMLIEKGTIQKDITIRDRIWTFRSLFDEDYTWRDQFVNLGSPAGMLASQRTPTLAVACVAIDGISAEECAKEVEGREKEKDDADMLRMAMASQEPKYQTAYSLYTKLFSKLPREVILELYDQYVKEIDTPSRKFGEADLKNS